jgi:hypothetical protein
LYLALVVYIRPVMHLIFLTGSLGCP